jgi:hypothetical protein
VILPYFIYQLLNQFKMEKIYKSKSDLFGGKVTYTFDENLEKLKGKILAPKKLAEANRLLKNLKTPLPK